MISRATRPAISSTVWVTAIPSASTAPAPGPAIHAVDRSYANHANPTMIWIFSDWIAHPV
ncbi:hypothetical protein NRB20_75910 [Nocardia sp. RB20]|uniref:Uncharacterized protein n=1 Tax=Nocardia macrotermitis TaxID=2585198 RepID=A0A7K0DGN1_9NOCA|nr:hypothetical protein [Nocardia macrotermitis]